MRPTASCLYEGYVVHRRLTPRHHRFKYQVFSMLLDIDELPHLDKEIRWFGWNRWNLFSFHDRDHGPKVQTTGRDLNAWLDGLLAQAGLAAQGARYVLCYPRILGYVFNPLSVWFCHDEADRLAAIIYEVHNTYDERHAYVLPAGNNMEVVRHSCAKQFYVSPFLSHDCRYQFRIRPPSEDVAIAIQEDEAGKPILNASFAGRRGALTDKALLTMLLRYPLMTLKVVAAIHFEAARLMLKGVRRHRHAPKPGPVPAG